MSARSIATREGGTANVPGSAVEGLRAAVRGELLEPGDPGFAEATLLWNGMVQREPALVVRPSGTADVVAALAFAREHDVALSVRGGGHNIAGTAVAEGGLTIDLSGLRGVVVDPDRRTATVQGGCRLGDVDREAQLHGLATPLGFISEVGVAGLTLGGGLGYLTRRFGWTVDNLLGVEIVTADGRVRQADAERHSDLFWAVRGAGANLGVVTSLTFRLHPVGPLVHGGLIAWPFERAGEVMEAYRRLTATAPRELSGWLVLMCAPPAPFVPPDWHGRRLCAMAVCHSGPREQAASAMARIRAFGEPVFDLLGERPYTEVQSYLDDTEPKGAHYYWKTEFAPALEPELLRTARELFATCPVPDAQIGFLHLEGALNERPQDDGSVGNRDAAFAVGVNAMWEPDDPAADDHRRWIRDAWSRVRVHSTGASYINFQSADEGQDRIEATYGANLERLLEVKHRYDPANVFRSNRNIATVAAPAAIEGRLRAARGRAPAQG